MKDWRRSPELSSMMGLAAVGCGEQPAGQAEQLQADGGEPSDRLKSSARGEASAVANAPRPQTKLDISLAEMARRVIIQRIYLFDTLGDAPFQLVRPILEQCPAKKLWALEEDSSHFIRETGTIWKRNCLRDFRDLQPQQLSTAQESVGGWRELYRLKMLEDLEARELATARIKEKYASLKADKEANRVRVVPDLPASRQRGPATAPRFGGAASTTVSSTNKTQGQRMLSKARKQAQAQTQAQAPKMSAIRRPAIGLSGSTSGANSTAFRPGGSPHRATGSLSIATAEQRSNISTRPTTSTLAKPIQASAMEGEREHGPRKRPHSDDTHSGRAIPAYQRDPQPDPCSALNAGSHPTKRPITSWNHRHDATHRPK